MATKSKELERVMDEFIDYLYTVDRFGKIEQTDNLFGGAITVKFPWRRKTLQAVFTLFDTATITYRTDLIAGQPKGVYKLYSDATEKLDEIINKRKSSLSGFADYYDENVDPDI